MFTAVYRWEIKGDMHHMSRCEYPTKTEFAKVLRQNGMRVIAVLTNEEIEDIMNMKKYDYLRSKDYQQYIRETLKEHEL